MDNMELDGEVQIYNAVKDLTPADIEAKVRNVAAKTGFNITPEHMDVILTLIDHYKETCQEKDCHAATPHMRFLNHTYESQGGSKYLYKLFDQGSSVGAGGSEVGIITRIHELAGLPELTDNVDDGVGTVI
ncbi:MAG: TusE/DsrC/DsvC family sulfur relay protein [Thiothrix litoralis]|jgi:sulfur relay (sulfurtransferase) DsrC/TusE family protein|uniref:TusE/DsrC/DsvC family sulfur relay protein n=1 Tax=Thiothrix litoralis TaxID=2891210 RepID=UPI003C739431